MCRPGKSRPKVIKKYPEPILTSPCDLFNLIRSIVGQQISVWLLMQFGTIPVHWLRISPELILKPTPEMLKNCGLTSRKVEYIRVFQTCTKEYAEIDWEVLSDDEAKRKPIALRGVGPWTAEMILMFSLLRPDIFQSMISRFEPLRTSQWGEVASKEALDQADNCRRTVATWF